ncbi:Oxoglutarate and iron-dependent oxygenase degradation C-term-domain-containing protein [Phycomyces nitens]|nr:Oxoglutarate and iron-dependent oxygenase degradation C-term-domain-containing protein [Phycomyces nitens]
MTVLTKRKAEATQEPAEKKIKTVQEVFHKGLLDPQSRDRLQKACQESRPYQHCAIERLVNDELLRKIYKEIGTNLRFTLKETDIYKVNQTGDLVNMDGLASEERSRLKHLFELRNAIYSDEFRSFVSHITGCGPLSPSKFDMSINTYNSGCHLLNHDDVIGTRRVSFILYMPNPDEAWDPAWGGALELYPVVSKGTPAIEPTVSLPPKWNQFAMFTVLPGYSFHSVEEVVGQNKSRLSIQGWFHVPQPGEDGYEPKTTAEKSSLEMLEAEEVEEAFESYKEPLDEQCVLDQEDLKVLSEWMNPIYLETKCLGQISERFMETSAVQLKDILRPDFAESLKNDCLDQDQQDGFTATKMAPHGSGIHKDWIANGPPVRQRFLRSTSKANLGGLQSRLESGAFRRWVTAVSQLVPIGYRGMTRRFRPGHDYTLATAHSKSVLDLTLCLATCPTKSAAEDWESGEYGGYECYMAPHEGQDDPAIYKASADDDGALLTMPAGWNELGLVLRDEGVLRFVKYISARAPGSRWDVAMEYEIDQEEEEEEE